MKKLLIAAVFTFIAALAGCVKKEGIEVTRVGQLEDLIKKGDMKTKTRLSEYSAIPHFYAIGSVTNLKGFIQILDSKCYTASVVQNQLVIDSTYTAEATLFLSATVPEWKEFVLPAEVITWTQLQQFIGNQAEKFDINRNEASPFLLKGTASRVNWRVVDWDPNDQEVTYKKTVTSGLNGILQNEYIEGIGFYSKEPYDVLSHKENTMHLHFVNHNHSIAGHIDDIEIGPGMILFLPVIPKAAS